ncbi:glycosyltransferase family 2 protein [Pararhizobium haloflavum]|uniref:glycosyltransferase family 2 protein n=1 Tax=Pararhizobium haloflavum TaxID=2037914 RepID=UPI000C1962C1|nr:glycosyltransferase family A protein [Pararhizobium haloflavum]
MASIDIAIPCYGHGNYLRDCVMSATAEDVGPLRILIIDNASPDDSLEKARQLAASDSRIALSAHAHNLGPHASFNEGVAWAEADYFMILCADDLLTPGSLRALAGTLDADPNASFAYGTDVHWIEGQATPQMATQENARFIRVSGTRFIEERCRNPEHYIAAGMVLVRTAAQKRAGLYRDVLPHTDDFEMLLRLAMLGDVRRTDSPLGIKRMHGANRTLTFTQDPARDLKEREAALASFFANEGAALANASRLRRIGRRSIAQRAYWCGLKSLAHGRAGAWSHLALAFQLAPRMALLPPLGYLKRMERPIGTALKRPPNPA